MNTTKALGLFAALAFSVALWGQSAPPAKSVAERLGYPTQKPLKLLERIVSAASRKGALVIDPFCGSGTTILAAEKVGRKMKCVPSAAKAGRVYKHLRTG